MHLLAVVAPAEPLAEVREEVGYVGNIQHGCRDPTNGKALLTKVNIILNDERLLTKILEAFTKDSV